MCENIEIGVAEGSGIYSTTIDSTTTDEGGYTTPTDTTLDMGTTTDEGGYTPPANPAPDAGTTTEDDGVHSDSENPGVDVNGSKKPSTEPEEDDDGVHDDPENPSGDMNDSSNTSTTIPMNVTVISCSKSDWVDTSKVMWNDMFLAINGHTEYSEEDIENNVLKPTTATAFSEAWISANKCMVIHTHGSPRGLSGHENDDSQPPIISLDEIKLLSSNTNIDFVMITACQVAGGDAYNNVAYWMSKKINPNGIVIANKYYVVGGSTDFTASSGDCGWVVYQNGEIVRCEADIEPTLDMGKAYDIYTELTNIN